MELDFKKLPKRIREKWDDLACRILDLVEPNGNSALIVGFSGGPDSTALLSACAYLRDNWERIAMRSGDESDAPVSGGAGNVAQGYENPPLIVAAHFNHGLRAESDADEEWCRKFAKTLGLEFTSKQWKRDPKAKRSNGGIETLARYERIKFLEETASLLTTLWDKKASAMKEMHPAVLTGHTLDDQAETFLMNVARGAGLAGAGGMSERSVLCRQQGEIAPNLIGDVEITYLLKPFLNTSKSDLAHLLSKSGIDYLNDATNLDPDYTPRNRIRLEVIPKLVEAFPDATAKLAQFASICAEAAESIEEKARAFLDENARPFSEAFEGLLVPTIGDVRATLLPKEILRFLSSPLLSEVLRIWLAENAHCRAEFSYNLVESFEASVRAKKTARRPPFEWSSRYIWIEPTFNVNPNPIFHGAPFGEELLDGKPRIIDDQRYTLEAQIWTGRGLQNRAGERIVAASLDEAVLPLRFVPVKEQAIFINPPSKKRIRLRRLYSMMGIPASVLRHMRILVDAKDWVLWHPTLGESTSHSDFNRVTYAKNAFILVFHRRAVP
jgi:tRNA(Ile)-lysidine synthetase-like protein